MTENKTLILLTDSFPYATGETFVHNEIQYLADAFEKVIIISSAADPLKPFNLPDNVIAFNCPSKLSFQEKVFSTKYLFSSLFWNEVSFIQTVLKIRINLLIIKTILDTVYSAEKLMNFIHSKVTEEGLNLLDVVLYSYWNDYKALAISRLKQKNGSLVAFARAHNWDIYFERQPSDYLPFKRKTIELLDAVYFISEDGRKYLLDKLKSPSLSNKMKVNRLGVDGSGMTKQEVVDFSASTSSGRKEQLRIVSCSRIEPVKRLELIIRGIASLQNVSISWVHLGDGSASGPISEMASDVLDTKNHISYSLKGDLTNPEVYNYYKNNACHVFINLSEYEGIPISIMEAMSFGIPVIATDVGGNSEIVNKENGILLGSNPSIDEIVDSINKFYHMNEESYLDYRKSAFETWQIKYNAEKNYSEFVKDIVNLG